MADKRPDSWNPWLPPSRETLIDKQIRDAQEAGAFDELPFQGERLPLGDDSAAGDWALAYRMLKGSNFAPPWIETDKEVRDLLARRDAILARAPRPSAIGRRRDETELRRIVVAANDAIFRLNHEAPTARTSTHARPRGSARGTCEGTRRGRLTWPARMFEWAEQNDGVRPLSRFLADRLSTGDAG